MPAPKLILPAFRDRLIDDGIVRDPRVAGDEPPLWLDPRDGAIAPGDRDGVEGEKLDGSASPLVLSAVRVSGLPAARHEGAYKRWDGIDLHYRSTRSIDAQELEPRIREAFLGRGRERDFDLGGRRCIEAVEFRPFQPLYAGPQGYAYVHGWLFDLYVEDPV